MSTQTTTRAKLFTSLCILIACVTTAAHAEWKIDLSRRKMETTKEDLREPASMDAPIAVDMQQQPSQPPAAKSPGFFDQLFESNTMAGEIVVLNTEKGFVPSTIRVKKGAAYQIHIVNVNEKEKNISFVLDSFSEHHATFYGKIKSFVIRPQKEGVFKFVSPETSAQGKLVVFPGNGPENRQPASEE